MLDIRHREFVYLRYYFELQLRQILPYWVLGMVIGSVISVFGKGAIHRLFGSIQGLCPRRRGGKRVRLQRPSVFLELSGIVLAAFGKNCVPLKLLQIMAERKHLAGLHWPKLKTIPSRSDKSRRDRLRIGVELPHRRDELHDFLGWILGVDQAVGHRIAALQRDCGQQGVNPAPAGGRYQQLPGGHQPVEGGRIKIVHPGQLDLGVVPLDLRPQGIGGGVDSRTGNDQGLASGGAGQLQQGRRGTVHQRTRRHQADQSAGGPDWSKTVPAHPPGASLTGAGKSLYGDAKRIIQASNEAVIRARNAMQSGENVVRIGTSPMTPGQYILKLRPTAQELCPGVKFQE